jgi:hypothetical protein
VLLLFSILFSCYVWGARLRQILIDSHQIAYHIIADRRTCRCWFMIGIGKRIVRRRRRRRSCRLRLMLPRTGMLGIVAHADYGSDDLTKEQASVIVGRRTLLSIASQRTQFNRRLLYSFASDVCVFASTCTGSSCCSVRHHQA